MSSIHASRDDAKRWHIAGLFASSDAHQECRDMCEGDVVDRCGTTRAASAEHGTRHGPRKIYEGLRIHWTIKNITIVNIIW
jgi:hypothetical protein